MGPLKPEAEALWNGIYALGDKLGNSSVRLRQIADSEQVMGYTESARQFRETADEVSEARIWVCTILRAKCLEIQKDGILRA